MQPAASRAQVPIKVLPYDTTGSAWCVLVAAPSRMEGAADLPRRPGTPGEELEGPAAPSSFTDWQQDGLAAEVQKVDDECFAEVSGLRGLSEALAGLTGSRDGLKSNMDDFWRDRHDRLDRDERADAQSAVRVQRLCRGHLARINMRKWAAEARCADAAAVRDEREAWRGDAGLKYMYKMLGRRS